MAPSGGVFLALSGGDLLAAVAFSGDGEADLRGLLRDVSLLVDGLSKSVIGLWLFSDYFALRRVRMLPH
jgi:hypothetical protein